MNADLLHDRVAGAQVMMTLEEARLLLQAVGSIPTNLSESHPLLKIVRAPLVDLAAELRVVCR